MAINAFIKFIGPDIAGSSTLKGHETHIEVMSWSYGCSQPAQAVRSTGGGGTIEKVHHSPFTFTKQLDTASDDLLKMCWTGKHIDKATFAAYRASGDAGASQSGVKYLTIELETVIVQDMTISGSEGIQPMENVSLNYGKITFTYDPQEPAKGTPGGVQVISHDIKTHVIA